MAKIFSCFQQFAHFLIQSATHVFEFLVDSLRTIYKCLIDGIKPRLADSVNPSNGMMFFDAHYWHIQCVPWTYTE